MRCRIGRRTRARARTLDGVGKEAAGKRNGSKSRVKGDDVVKMFWGTSFVCGKQGHKKDRCPTRKESDKKATVQPQRSCSAIAPSAYVSTGARLRAPLSPSGSVPQVPASRTHSDVARKLAVSCRTLSVET